MNSGGLPYSIGPNIMSPSASTLGKIPDLGSVHELEVVLDMQQMNHDKLLSLLTRLEKHLCIVLGPYPVPAYDNVEEPGSRIEHLHARNKAMENYISRLESAVSQVERL